MIGRQLALVGLVLVAAPVWAQQPARSGMDRDRESAMQAYADGHWSSAFEQLATLADRGDAESARIAVLMVRHGASLYRTSFSTDSGRLVAWKGLLRSPQMAGESAQNAPAQSGPGAPRWTSR